MCRDGKALSAPVLSQNLVARRVLPARGLSLWISRSLSLSLSWLSLSLDFASSLCLCHSFSLSRLFILVLSPSLHVAMLVKRSNGWFRWSTCCYRLQWFRTETARCACRHSKSIPSSS